MPTLSHLEKLLHSDLRLMGIDSNTISNSLYEEVAEY